MKSGQPLLRIHWGTDPLLVLRAAFMHMANLHRTVCWNILLPRHGYHVARRRHTRLSVALTVLLPRGQYLYMGTEADSNKAVYIYRLRIQRTNQPDGFICSIRPSIPRPT